MYIKHGIIYYTITGLLISLQFKNDIFFFILAFSFLFCHKNVLKVLDKSPKISNIKVSDKMTYANSADPDQTAPEGAV